MITTSELPPTVQPGELLARYAWTPTVAVVITRPDHREGRPAPLLNDLINATTPGIQMVETRSHVTGLLQSAISRIVGQRVTHVIVTGSEHLWIDDIETLLSLSVGLGSQLVLTYGHDGADKVIKRGTQLLARDVDWEALELPAPVPQPAAKEPDPFPETVPLVDFPLFRATARRQLPPDEFAALDAVYVDAYRATRARAPETSAQAAALLRDLVTVTFSASRATTIARAVQAACLESGYLLKLDLRQLTILVSEGTHSTLTPDHYRNLEALTEPWQAAIPVLADMGLTNTQIEQLSINDLPGLNVPDEVAGIFRAHLTWRYLEGASANDPLFLGDRQIKRAITIAASHGIPVDASRISTVKPDRWQHTTRVLLERVA